MLQGASGFALWKSATLLALSILKLTGTTAPFSAISGAFSLI